MSLKMTAIGVTAAAALGCGSSHFVQVDRPIVIEGVVVSLLDQQCEDRPRAAPSGQPILDLGLTMQVRNTGIEDATFAPGEASLVAGGMAIPPVVAHVPTIIRPGSARTFTVRFQGMGDFRCDAPMAVVLDDALERRPSGAAHHAIRFRGRVSRDWTSLTSL